MLKTRNNNNRKRPRIIKYVFIAALIFCLALMLSFCAKLLLVSLPFANFSEEQITVMASLIEGAVGAIAAGFVLYQLKGEELVEIRENEINEAEFYQHFINYWLETDRMFIEHPECRKYFYESADVSLLSPMSNEYQLVMGFAEYFDDLFRYSETEIEKQDIGYHSIPKDQIESYKVYIQQMRSMPVFRVYRERYGSWVNSTEKDLRN